MNEIEWLNSIDVAAMRRFLERPGSPIRTRWQGWVTVPSRAPNERKSQLFATACCRRMTQWLPDSFVAWLDWLDDAADGKRERPQYPRDRLSWDELESRPARESIWYAMISVGAQPFIHHEVVVGAVVQAFVSLRLRSELTAWVIEQQERGVDVSEIPDAVQAKATNQLRIEEFAVHAAILRDLVGNPFRRVELIPAWRTRNAIELARQIYDERAFDGMPILADALEEAGCDRVEILEHCRSAGPHVRGCWVVDDVLIK